MNFDQKIRLTFMLAQQGDARKISDIQYTEERNLLKLFQAAAGN